MAQDVAPRLVRLNPASRGGQVGEQGLQGGQWEASHNSCPHQEELGERVEVARGGLSHRLGWGCLGWARSRGLALEKGRKRHKCDMLRQKNQQDSKWGVEIFTPQRFKQNLLTHPPEATLLPLKLGPSLGLKFSLAPQSLFFFILISLPARCRHTQAHHDSKTFFFPFAQVAWHEGYKILIP